MQPSLKSNRPVAWITGSGAARVGQVIAKEFAARGYNIVLHAHRSLDQAQQCLDELHQQNVEAILVQGSVDEPEFAKASVQTIVNRFGRLDVLINSAAIWDWKSLEETSVEDIQHHFSVNTLGTFLCSQAAGLQMVRQPEGGAIVLIGDWAVQQPYRDFSAYFCSKGSIETMTRSLAVELATRNPSIRVNAIMPGPVMLDPSVSVERAEAARELSLLKRHGKPEDVAEAAFFLATQEFITGVCLNVDGGRSIFSGNDATVHPKYP